MTEHMTSGGSKGLYNILQLSLTWRDYFLFKG